MEESQRLCRNAESAITEMEHTAYEQFKLQNEGMQNKHQIIKTRYDKAVTKSNEMKLAIVVRILFMFHVLISYKPPCSEGQRDFIVATITLYIVF